MKAVYPTEFDRPFNGLEWLEYYAKHKVWHPGWDLNRGNGNDDLGQPVVSPVGAIVEYISPEPTPMNRYNGGLGWFVILYHEAYGLYSRYAHLNRVNARLGDKLKTGESFAELGKSGTTYAHLHWEVFPQKTFNIMKSHWRKFAYYPSGKTKAWVMDHFIDGLAWIDELNEAQEQVAKWAQPHLDTLMSLDPKVTDGSRPKDTVTREEVWTMLGRLYENLK